MSKVLIVKNSDKRIEYIIEYLKREHEVVEITDELQLYYELSDKSIDVLVLPIRSINKEFIVDGTDIKLTDNYLMLLKGKTIYTGLKPTNLEEVCINHQINLLSYLTEDLAIKNNYITTEGVIEAIVTHSDKAIFNSKILIIGYGKLGQIAANVLKQMESSITISARNEKDIVHGKISGFNMIRNHQLFAYIDKFDFIINTIPYRIIDSNLIDKLMDKDIMIIDIASSPYGLDHEYAKSKNIKCLLLPGIPGIIAPKTAGRLIGECINNLIGGEVDE